MYNVHGYNTYVDTYMVPNDKYLKSYNKTNPLKIVNYSLFGVQFPHFP